MTPMWLQYGAMGLLAMVLAGVGWGLVYIGVPLMKSLVTSINGLRDEVASFRKQQERFGNLLTLLLVREFGEETAMRLVREEHDDERFKQRDQQGRGEAPSGPRPS